MLKGPASRKALFSESAFLNKPSERSNDLSEIDDGSDDGSTSDHLVPQETRIPNGTKKDRAKCTKRPAFKKPLTCPTAESEVWDIEVQSKLPSSVCGVSSDFETKGTAPVVLDLRGAQWSASVDATEEYEECPDKTLTLSIVQSGPRIESVMVCSSPPAGSDLGEGILATHAADVSSLHPSHSASQVGRHAAETQASDRRLVTSRYFVEPKPVFEQKFIPNSEPIMGPNDSLDMLGVEGQHVGDAELDIQMIHRPASPMSSPTSALLHVAGFQQYDMLPQANDCPCEECWRSANVPSELVGGSDLDYFESAIAESRGDRFTIGDVDQEGGAQDWHPWHGEYEGGHDLLVPDYEYDVESEMSGEPWESCVDESICWEEDEGGDFLEGRALLRGVEGAGCLSGLDEVERDVASRLRYHWRPLRL